MLNWGVINGVISKMKKSILTIFLILLSVNQIQASLTEAHCDTLMKHLKILSDQGWVNESKNICNNIIGNTDYTWQEWKEFFSDYYRENPATQNLWGYLGYPAYHWFGDDVHYNLQRSHIAIFPAKIDSIFKKYNVYLATSLASQPDLRKSLFVYLRQTARLINGSRSLIDDSVKDQVVESVETWIDKYPDFFKKDSDTEPDRLPYVGAIRWQLHSILLDYQGLTSDRKKYLKELLAIKSRYLDIFNKHSLYIADNNRIAPKDLHFIDTLMTLIPDTLTSHNYLSNRGYYFSGEQEEEGINKYNGAINTFATIGGYSENPFPADISADYIDGFCVVVAHETNHRVDPDYIYQHEELESRRKELVEQAGNVDKQYLRSNVGADYFQNAPQEFIASIANQWFCSSIHTLQLGIKRYEDGYSEPLNQVLYFCELYSAGSDTTQFYEVNRQGNIIMTEIPVERNANGDINQLEYKGTTYSFQLDPDGNVTGYEKLTGINKNNLKSTQFELINNYPNPFNNRTVIRYAIDQKTRVEVAIYDIAGNKIKSLVDEYKKPGVHSTFWNGKDNEKQSVPSGTYIFRLSKNDRVDFAKGLLIK